MAELSPSSERIVAEAQSWLGTPYGHRGATKGVAVDCAMLLVRVYIDAGVVKDFDPGWYVNDFMLHRAEEQYLSWVEKFGYKIDGEPLPGDVALFRVGRCIGHGGILETPEVMIHADRLARVVERREIAAWTPRRGEDMTTAIDRPRLVGFWRVRQ